MSRLFPLSRSFIRFQSTTAAHEVKKIGTVRELLRSSTTKSIFLVMILTSVVGNMMDRRKQLDALKANHKVKMSLLSEILIKLEKGEKVDLQQELTLLSRIPTTKETEIDFDEKLNEFLQLADEPQEHAPVTKAQPSTYL